MLLNIIVDVSCYKLNTESVIHGFHGLKYQFPATNMGIMPTRVLFKLTQHVRLIDFSQNPITWSQHRCQCYQLNIGLHDSDLGYFNYLYISIIDSSVSGLVATSIFGTPHLSISLYQKKIYDIVDTLLHST